MFHHNNPFDGWSNAGNQHSSPWRDDGPPPSVFGALPYPSTSPPSSALATYTFTAFKPNVLNCTVLGPDAQPCFYLVTDNKMPGYTLIKSPKGASVALVEWQNHPLVEVRGSLYKQEVRQWLPLSREKRSRHMDLGGMRYAWTPQADAINLHTLSRDRTPPVFLGRITRSSAGIRLDLTTYALKLNLRDACIVATFLLQCGKNID